MPQHRSDAEIADAVDWPGNIPGQSGFMSAEPAQSSTQISKEVIIKNKNNSLTLAEVEAIQQFEASHRAGQAAPTCMVFCEEVGRFGITILEGRYSVEEARTEDEQWYRHEADGMRTPIDNPLEGAWQAAAEVREELKRKLDLKFNTIAVGWFPDMEPDEDILTSGPSGKGTDCCCVTCLAGLRPKTTG